MKGIGHMSKGESAAVAIVVIALVTVVLLAVEGSSDKSSEYVHPKWAQPPWTLVSEISAARAHPKQSVWVYEDLPDHERIYIVVNHRGSVVAMSVLGRKTAEAE